ncbi:MAG: hypothetical protein VYD19_08100 [Myxococcota bacterium]|nr:hypothetical protein [Myxococcota bacterium]
MEGTLMAKSEEEAVDKSSKGSVGLIIIALLNLAGIGGIFFFLTTELQAVDLRVVEATKEIESRVVEEKESTSTSTQFAHVHASGPLVEIGAVSTTLRGEDQKNARPVRLKLVVELDTEAARADAEQKVAQLRYHLGRLLAAQELDGVQGEALAEVRAAMTRRADAVLSSRRGRVLNVWPKGWSYIN